MVSSSSGTAVAPVTRERPSVGAIRFAGIGGLHLLPLELGAPQGLSMSNAVEMWIG